MSEASTDTTQTRPQPAAAERADAGGSGKHRGIAATSEDSSAPAQGRHRRTSAEQRAS
ncbi:MULTISPECIES: hypothetical protein [Streptomyces]|uniref:Uncharacterized protein n=1 Tax=Streptomyces chengmaiensis TaxID=3040919 RepID=A0ABT6HWU7_9ACTN|nr:MULTISPECIES: hypothetical protein [Streptomyces]MDH2393172.1 hypothetical protein [Streptomyces chengmaiensis]WRQ79196.1 hypothetical protein I3F59_007300 [Streptomyces sp. MUM 178J]